MSEDLNKKIRQITDMLGQENLPDNLKNILSLFAGGEDSEDTQKKSSSASPEENISKKNQSSAPVREENQKSSDIEENLEMVRRIKRIMDGVNTNNDPRIHLLNAIRPFLSNTRQKKVNNCIKLLHMVSISKFLDDNEKISF